MGKTILDRRHPAHRLTGAAVDLSGTLMRA
jgi:hypothetical protein